MRNSDTEFPEFTGILPSVRWARSENYPEWSRISEAKRAIGANEADRMDVNDHASRAVRGEPDHRTSRRTEAVMLVFAGVVCTAAYAAVDIGQGRTPAWPALAFGGGFLAVLGAAHLVVRRFAPHADPLLLPCTALLNGLGVVLIHRLDLDNAPPGASPATQLLTGNASTQLVWTAGALVLFAGVLWRVRDHRQLARYSYTAGVLGLTLLVLPGLLPASISEVNGAKLWIRLGPLSIQPGEFAKILVIIFAAAFLVAKRDLFTAAGRRMLGMTFPRARDLAPLIVAWGVSVGILTLEKELGASLLYFGIVLVMIYVATERASWLFVGLVFFAGGSVIAYLVFDHVRARVQVWNDPFAYADTTGYQLVQALFGIADGGLVGTGLGRGDPGMVPFAGTDFISSTILEELGLAGLGAVLVLYLVIAGRGLRAAITTRDGFGTLLAGGLAFGLVLQVFVVVGGVTGLIPLTGMTMPFLSYGGSSLLANYALVAVLLRISDAARRPARPAPRMEPLDQAHTELVRRPRFTDP